MTVDAQWPPSDPQQKWFVQGTNEPDVAIKAVWDEITRRNPKARFRAMVLDQRDGVPAFDVTVTYLPDLG